MHWQFGEMEFGEMKRNTSNWSNFCMLLRRTCLTASAGLSCCQISHKIVVVLALFIVVLLLVFKLELQLNHLFTLKMYI